MHTVADYQRTTERYDMRNRKTKQYLHSGLVRRNLFRFNVLISYYISRFMNTTV